MAADAGMLAIDTNRLLPATDLACGRLVSPVRHEDAKKIKSVSDDSHLSPSAASHLHRKTLALSQANVALRDLP